MKNEESTISVSWKVYDYDYMKKSEIIKIKDFSSVDTREINKRTPRGDPEKTVEIPFAILKSSLFDSNALTVLVILR
jgi:hypothetical protein